MTQQPYPPQQYPQPGYPQQPQQYPPQPMQQGYPAQPQQPYPPQQAPAYAPPMGQPYPQQPMGQGQPGPAAPPVQSGSIDDYYSQPVAAGGPGISWKDKPIGTTYAGVIASAPTVQQDSDYTTKLPKFQRDGVTPQWVMLIPLERVQSNFAFPNGQPEFPTGEVVFYARGKDKEEIARAMAEAGCSGAPQAGATFQVTLVERKPQRQGNPKNVVRISYTPAGTETQIGSASPAAGQVPAAPQMQQQQQAPQVQAPAPQPAAPQVQQQIGTPAPQQWAAAGVEQGQTLQAPPAPIQQAALPQSVPQAVPAQGTPAQAPGPQPPAGMPPEQAAILQGVLGGAAQQAQG